MGTGVVFSPDNAPTTLAIWHEIEYKLGSFIWPGARHASLGCVRTRPLIGLPNVPVVAVLAGMLKSFIIGPLVSSPPPDRPALRFELCIAGDRLRDATTII